MKIQIVGEDVLLLQQKALFLEKWKALVIADVHFGKVNHFRTRGIPVPDEANQKNVENLVDCIHLVKPDQIIFLGDLFHSHYNPEWEVVGEVVKHFSMCSFQLVLGNHDILSDLQYQRHGIIVTPSLQLGPLWFTHEPQAEGDATRYNLAGHLHPGVRLHGSGRQSLVLPCFHFGQTQAVLPAFGSFTGLAPIKPKKLDRIFAVTPHEILPLHEA